ncbi:MAG: 50S ribosomal protein L4 [Clostridiales bacterium]|jgi:large subunit ribosomal protein L4|nr:50S ribosomal protein L4 [Clostridiales bacterium]MDD2571735.1 50S ribosomal protein L4 [Eubacteriales bacterium]MDY0119219.1 50S ribosomal protein L4 [Clostridia bacterium]NLG30575.1 50S ribosomal protein L4 [Clostridiaceae bacterium]MCK9349981.1 50S ribosomal protein L4 [Clostridiales bacterium]
MQLDVYNMSGDVVGSMDLSDEIFAIEPNEDAVYRVMIAQQANKRQGTHKAKGRSEVRGGGRKPFRQKGTGRARQGSTRSPNHVGGGVVFGPAPRSYRVRLPRKLRRLALLSMLSSKAVNEKLVVLDELTIENGKTRVMADVLKNIGADTSALIVTAGKNESVVRSARNLPDVKTAPVNALSVLDLMKYDRMIATREAIETLEEVYAS